MDPESHFLIQIGKGVPKYMVRVIDHPVAAAGMRTGRIPGIDQVVTAGDVGKHGGDGGDDRVQVERNQVPAGVPG